MPGHSARMLPSRDRGEQKVAVPDDALNSPRRSELKALIMRIHDLYSALPAPLQNAACSAYGYRLNSRRYSGPYNRMERAGCAREWWPPEQLTGFVNGRLLRVVEHAAKWVPYYRKLFAQSKI